MALFLGRDPDSGSVETFDYDESEDLTIIRRYCDVEPVINRNKRLQGVDGEGSWSGGMRHYASIPNDVAYKWLVEEGINCWRAEHRAAVLRKLDDPDWRHLKVTTKRHR